MTVIFTSVSQSLTLVNRQRYLLVNYLFKILKTYIFAVLITITENHRLMPFGQLSNKVLIPSFQICSMKFF